MKKVICMILAVILILPIFAANAADDAGTPPSVDASGELGELDCKSAILIEADTGTVLFEQDSDRGLPPASVTKIMTLLLVMEAIKEGRLAWEQTVYASANACSMGGSQIYLKEGEAMSVRDLVKSVVIASANDAAVALAETVSGSEEAFVKRMNERAAELGIKNSKFENTNGLDDTVTDHYMSARDIATLSRELIRYDEIIKFSSTWMDSIRNGSFGLTNTNRLVRFYDGCTGLKTGSTAKAGFCVSTTATRDGMTLIAVIMGAPSRDTRNACAAKLLDMGFAQYELYKYPDGEEGTVRVLGGSCNEVSSMHTSFSAVIPKGSLDKIEHRHELPEALKAPIVKGATVGRLLFLLDGEVIGEAPIVAESGVDKINFSILFSRVLLRFFGCR